MKLKNIIYLILGILCGLNLMISGQTQKLKIGPEKRFLVKEDGSPFVWIGETNWFFAKLPSETIDKILDKRSEQGFTVMFVSCREEMYNGGGTGFVSNPNEKWWNYLDEYISKCEQRNLYVGITLGWWGKLKSLSEKELYDYGKWVGERYKNNNNIVWLTLGEAGSHKRKAELPREKLRALVRGIRDGDSGNKLLTIHADYKRGTSLSEDGEFCDFNNWQTSQWESPTDLPKRDERSWTVWEAIEFDYNKRYIGYPKPTLDAEAMYENNKDFCGATTFEIRRRAYFTILAGAFGHTYGAGGIWDGLSSRNKCSGSALDALDYKGAEQIGFLSGFLHNLKNSFLKMRPNQEFIISNNPVNYDEHVQASVACDASFALVYSPSGTPFKLDLSMLNSKKLKMVWFNPRENSYEKDKIVLHKNNQFKPPGKTQPGNDWILVIGKELPF